MEMIRLEHVTKSFGEHTVLDDFSISIPEGEFLTVIGRSGCGKTTMLKMINGLNCPEKGKVYIGGKDIGEENIIELRRKIGYVIQNKGLFPHMTVEKNITYVPVISGKKDKKTNHELACRLIETVGLINRCSQDTLLNCREDSSKELGLHVLLQQMQELC